MVGPRKDIEESTSSKCISVVVAHPDDESLGMGGTLAKYATQGVATFIGSNAGSVPRAVLPDRVGLPDDRRSVQVSFGSFVAMGQQMQHPVSEEGAI